MHVSVHVFQDIIITPVLHVNAESISPPRLHTATVGFVFFKNLRVVPGQPA